MNLLLSFLVLSLSGCASMMANRQSKFIKEIDWPLPQIRMAIAAQIPIGQRTISQNGRELVSEYFVPARDGFKEGDQATNRYYVQYTVLGDRRPYDVEILVTHERRTLKGNDFVYTTYGHDDRLTAELAERLRKELSKRREDRNIIDDFRVY